MELPNFETPHIQNADETARALVERQLEAYNRRSLEEFCDCFSADVQVWRLGQKEPLALGAGAFRMIYQERFAKCPNLHAEVPNRVVLGPFVVDEEIVTGFQKDPLRVVAIYRSNGEKIDRVWFLRPD